MNSAEELWTRLAPLPSTNMGIQRPRSCGPGSYCEWPLEVEKNFTPAGFRPRLRRHARIAGQSAFCNKKRPAPQPEIRGNYYLSLGKQRYRTSACFTTYILFLKTAHRGPERGPRETWGARGGCTYSGGRGHAQRVALQSRFHIRGPVQCCSN